MANDFPLITPIEPLQSIVRPLRNIICQYTTVFKYLEQTKEDDTKGKRINNIVRSIQFLILRQIARHIKIHIFFFVLSNRTLFYHFFVSTKIGLHSHTWNEAHTISNSDLHIHKYIRIHHPIHFIYVTVALLEILIIRKGDITKKNKFKIGIYCYGNKF